jgi:hypothetical protein
VRSFEAGSLLDSVTKLWSAECGSQQSKWLSGARPGWTRWHRFVTVTPQSPRQAFGPSVGYDLAMG